MITINSHLELQPITLADQLQLWQLMLRIYPPAYGHFWKDDCSWYLQEQYGIENLSRELEETGSYYYMVRFRESDHNKPIGILRLRHQCTYPPLPENRSFKVHRLYLDSSIQGKGLGKKLMQYAEKTACATGHSLIWLDAMDTHKQAQGFYKSLGYQRTQLQQLPFELLHDEHRPMWYMHKML